MQEPRIIDSNVTAGMVVNVEEMFVQQTRDRFDLYDAAAAVNAAQKLKQKLMNEQVMMMKFRGGGAGGGTYEESAGSSSAEETGMRKSLPEDGLTMQSIVAHHQ